MIQPADTFNNHMNMHCLPFDVKIAQILKDKSLAYHES